MSTPYCLLYKLFTLKLTRKQLRGMLDHSDSPYIRGLGFMYIRCVSACMSLLKSLRLLIHTYWAISLGPGLLF